MVAMTGYGMVEKIGEENFFGHIDDALTVAMGIMAESGRDRA
jgi:hypothetical protein